MYEFSTNKQKNQISRICTITVYNPDKKQCNEDFLHTADMSFIDTNKLKDFSIRWCAVSNNLLQDFCNFGDTLYIKIGDELIDGKWVVHDRMNKRFTNYVDLLSDKKFNKRINKRKSIEIYNLSRYE